MSGKKPHREPAKKKAKKNPAVGTKKKSPAAGTGVVVVKGDHQKRTCRMSIFCFFPAYFCVHTPVESTGIYYQEWKDNLSRREGKKISSYRYIFFQSLG